MTKKKITLIIITTFIFLLPLFTYFYVFHYALSSNSADWAAFGSFVGGIYGPLFGLVSVIVLIITLREMQKNNQKLIESSSRAKYIDDIKWLTDLLRERLDKNKHIIGRGVFYNGLKISIKQKIKTESNVDQNKLILHCIELMKEYTGLYGEELILFEEIIYRVTHTTDDEVYALSVMILIGRLSPEERFWIAQYAKAHNSSATKWLDKTWRSFGNPTPELLKLIDQ